MEAELNNIAVWRDGSFVRDYAGSELEPAEEIILREHREELGGSVLELGCGAGRLTGHLIELGGEVHGLDISAAMVDYCRAHLPGGTFSEGDLRDLSGFPDLSRDAIVATSNVLDVLEEEDRLAVLREVRRVLRPGGLLMMSSHNREAIPTVRSPWDIRARNPIRMAGKLVLAPWRARNHRRLKRLERQEAGYALVNDSAHGFTLVHYYIFPEAQRSQFLQAGLEPIQTIRSDGGILTASDRAPDCTEIHYLARRPAAEPV